MYDIGDCNLNWSPAPLTWNLIMVYRAFAALLFLLFFEHGCSDQRPVHTARQVSAHPSGPPQVLAVYEAWFGHPRHISIGYSTQDPDVLRKQIRQAKAMGISGFVVDWYGYRQPFIDRSYALMQSIAAEENFRVAMMYDETDDEDGATEESMEDLKLFNKNYLAPNAPGRAAYLTYEDHPVIFIFPKGRHTDWDRVHTELAKWPKPPVLINEYPPDKYAPVIDGYYAWINPGPGGWAKDGTNWGEQYLSDFYTTMQSKYPDALAVGGVWASFDDSKASWSLNRHISPRCGKTYSDTVALWKRYFAQHPMPYVLVETWNDYEEGTAVEKGIADCPTGKLQPLANAF